MKYKCQSCNFKTNDKINVCPDCGKNVKRARVSLKNIIILLLAFYLLVFAFGKLTYLFLPKIQLALLNQIENSSEIYIEYNSSYIGLSLPFNKLTLDQKRDTLKFLVNSRLQERWFHKGSRSFGSLHLIAKDKTIILKLKTFGFMYKGDYYKLINQELIDARLKIIFELDDQKVNEQQAQIKNETKNIITCELLSDKKDYQLGEIPKFYVKITNYSNFPIYLPVRIDGSVLHRRYPYCSFKIICPDDKKTHGINAVCGNINRLRSEDFVKLKSGNSFNPFQEKNYEIINYGVGMSSNNMEINKKNFDSVGKYKISAYYSTKSSSIDTWLGDYEKDWNKKNNKEIEKIKLLFKATPKQILISNEITIEIINNSDYKNIDK
ncbi:MAG: hypothetical protein COA79_22315 [Planctomycetota bacterium]|nr:MAG: hypothetical protein COA79_22315 [Planctomycetota bacterium]